MICLSSGLVVSTYEQLKHYKSQPMPANFVLVSYILLADVSGITTSNHTTIMIHIFFVNPYGHDSKLI